MPADLVISGAGTAAVITLGAIPGRAHVIHQVHLSYSAAPTGGALTIGDGVDTLYSQDVIGSGPLEVTFDPPRRVTTGMQCIITVAAGGGAVVAKNNVNHTLD
jgi:hypothetical protein